MARNAEFCHRVTAPGCCLPVRLARLPDRHHGVVLMHHVVTVDRVLAQPVAEAEEQLHALVGMQLRHVLAAQVPGTVGGDPVARSGSDAPRGGCGWGASNRRVRFVRSHCSDAVLLHGEAEVLRRQPLGPIRPQSMNWPLTDHWPFKRSNLKVRTIRGVDVGAGQLVERRVGRRIDAVVRDLPFRLPGTAGAGCLSGRP